MVGLVTVVLSGVVGGVASYFISRRRRQAEKSSEDPTPSPTPSVRPETCSLSIPHHQCEFSLPYMYVLIHVRSAFERFMSALSFVRST